MADPLKMVRVYLRSTYAVGASPRVRSQLVSGKPIRRDVEPGTQLKQFLLDMPELGPPGSYDDMMLHVFVNGKIRGFDYVLKDGDVLDLHLPSSGG